MKTGSSGDGAKTSTGRFFQREESRLLWIDTLLAGRTAIVIAHRLATIERADEVLVMANGEIVEHGEREALAADPTSHFAGMLRSGHTLVGSGEGHP